MHTTIKWSPSFFCPREIWKRPLIPSTLVPEMVTLWRYQWQGGESTVVHLLAKCTTCLVASCTAIASCCRQPSLPASYKKWRFTLRGHLISTRSCFHFSHPFVCILLLWMNTTVLLLQERIWTCVTNQRFELDWIIDIKQHLTVNFVCRKLQVYVFFCLNEIALNAQ